MACYTVVELENLDDNELNRKARDSLGLPLTGGLSASNARAVRMEAGLLKAIAQVKKMSPKAMITRTGNKISVSVEVK